MEDEDVSIDLRASVTDLIHSVDSKISKEEANLQNFETENPSFKKIRDLFDTGQLTLAQQELQTFFKSFFLNSASNLSIADKMKFCYGLQIEGRIYFEMGDHANSKKSFQKSEKICDELNWLQLKALILQGFSQIFKREGKITKALEYLQYVFQVYLKLNDGLQQGYVFIDIGLCFYDTGQTFDAIHYFEKALSQSKKSNSDSLCGRSLLYLGNCYIRITEYKKALDFYEKSVELLKKSNDKLFLGHCLNRMGIVCDKISNLESAHEFFNQSLKVFEEINNKNGIAKNYSDKGYILLKEGKIEEGEKLLNSALTSLIELKNNLSESKCWNRLGIAKVLTGKFAEAEANFKKSIELSHSLFFLYGEASSLYELGTLYIQLGNWEKSRECYHLARSLFEICGDLNSAKKCVVHIGNNSSSPSSSPPNSHSSSSPTLFSPFSRTPYNPDVAENVPASTPIDEDSPKLAHVFEPFKVKSSTPCSICKRYIWGILKNCLRCTLCSILVHKQCSDKVSDCSGEKVKQILNEKLITTHNFQLWSFASPTYCHCCANFIWGLYNQGYQCTKCQYNVHKKCLDSVFTKCVSQVDTFKKVWHIQTQKDGNTSPESTPSEIFNLDDLVQLMQNPETGLVLKSHQKKMKIHQKSFTGIECINWLLQQNKITLNTRKEGIEVAKALYNNRYISHVSNPKIGFLDDEELYYFTSFYSSFAPVRYGINAQFYIDGKDTFEAMTVAVENAKKHIYMSFWIFCPVIYCRRTSPRLEKDRLDNILKRKAQEGVKIYILLWDETNLVMNNHSGANKKYVESLHPNIFCIRHPTIVPLTYSHHQKFIVIDSEISFVGGVDYNFGRFDTPDHVIVDTEGRYWWGIDYYVPWVTRPTTSLDPDVEYCSRTEEPRMPWHDVQISVDGLCAKDLANNFVQRWNHHRKSSQYLKYPILEYENTDTENSTPTHVKNSYRGTKTLCQAIRSIGLWSGGERLERSIYGAYLQAIEEAEHYIYFENQFIISGTAEGVENRVMLATFERICRAIENKQVFRVIVVFPQPEHVEPSNVPVLQYEFNTLCRGKGSLIELIKQKYPHVDPNDYVGLFQLRSYGEINGTFHTSQIFIHSKVLIVDDRVSIITSANLNDRSLLGDRDSEIGVVVWDDKDKLITMNGLAYRATEFSHNLRLKLWNEHCGLPLDDKTMSDPITDLAFREIMIGTATKNTEIFNHVFPFIAQDNITTYAQYDELRKNRKNLVRNPERLKGIKGRIQLYPRNFLLDEHGENKSWAQSLMPETLYQ